MKCFLLFLAIDLVASDKLDYTYLPPPGAQLSGGTVDDLYTPLEYPKDANQKPALSYQFPEIKQNNKKLLMDDDFDIKKLQISTDTQFTLEDFTQTIPYSKSDHSSTLTPGAKTTFKQSLDHFYLPSQNSYISHIDPNLRSGIETPTKDFKHSNNKQVPSEYYYIPTAQKQVNNNLETKTKNDFEPTITNANFDPKTFQSNNVFGLYGGNPMLMTLPVYVPEKNLNKNFTFNENKELNMSEMQHKTSVAHPFQTPLVGTNARSSHKLNATKTPSYLPNFRDQANNFNYTSSLVNVIKPVKLEQMQNIPKQTQFGQQNFQRELNKNAVILNYDNVLTPEGYFYEFETSSRIKSEGKATAVDGVKASGSYSYIGDDGKNYSVTYTADENGFQPRGDHLPTPPPIPVAIQKVIEQAARDKAAGIIDDGSYDENKYGYKNYQGISSGNHPSLNNHKSNAERLRNKNFGLKSDQKTSNLNSERSDYNITNNKNRPGSIINSAYEMKINKPSSIYLEQNQNSKNSSFHSDISFINKNLQRRPINNQIQQPVFVNNSNDQNLFKKLESTNKSENRNKMISKPTKNYISTPPNIINRYNVNKDTTSSTVDNFHQDDQWPKVSLKLDNSDTRISKYNPSHYLNSDEIHKATSYDTGYYYVPPIKIFQENKLPQTNLEQITIKSNPIIIPTTTNLPQNNGDNKIRNQDIYYKNISNNDSTAKPNIIDPKDLVRGSFDEDLQTEVNRNESSNIYLNNLNPPFNVFTTTPMTSQATQYETTKQYPNLYYKPISNINNYQPNLPYAVENKVITTIRRPEITVSQDFVTSTPGIDGFKLKVNQNVNIYRIGKPITPETTTRLPDTSFSINEFYSTVPTIKSDDITKYPENLDGNINSPSVNYDNEYYTTTSPLINYSNLENSFQLKTNKNPENQISDNTEISNLLPFSQDLNSRIAPTSDEILNEKVIGEDFSGPHRPQEFDPETGYYY